MLLVALACSMNAWSYRFTDNYTIEVKFKINAIGAGIAFAGYEGFGGNIAMWQYSVGADNNKSVLRPHDWRVGGVLLDEVGTGSVTLNTTDWFVTKIVISNNGNHADTYLRRDQDSEFVLIDSRDSRFNGEFRFGLVGAREDHEGSINESATFDYVKVTDNATNGNLYYEDFNTTNGDWRNDPVWNDAEGTLTVSGVNFQEVRYYPNNMFQDAIDMHYTVEADVTIENGYVSLIFGLTDSGSNYMWQISPNYYGDYSVCNYYHLDNGNESWKAHAGGPRYPGFEDLDFYDAKRHVMIEVKGNVVYTYIDGTLVDTFVQCDMTDLALLNPGKVGIRVDGGNGVWHRVYVDNVKLTEYDKDGNGTVKMNETFDDGVPHFFELSGKNATYASVVSVGGDYALYIDCNGTEDLSAKVRLIQTDVCYHNYANGICTLCGTYEEPGYDAGLAAYTIGNLGQLIRYSQIVNTENQAANGSLLCDIDMNYSDKFTPIGLNNDNEFQTPFRGTFYGNNHVIRNLYVKTNCEGGLFSRLRGGIIHNLGVENGHIESTANLRCGAIAGEHHDNAWMYNCYARGTFEFVTTHSQTNAVAGETAGGHFLNCYTTLPKLSCDYPMSGTSENSYEGVTAGQAETGELCYKLGAAFRQTIGEDIYPELNQTRGIVYPMTGAAYATLYNNDTAGTLSDNVTVYTGTQSGNYLTLTQQGNTIPAQTAVVLKGAEGYYSFTPVASAPAISGTNELLGAATDTDAAGKYILAKPEGKEAGFYKATTGTIKAGKAYLESTSGVKAFIFAEDDATSIKDLKDFKDLKDSNDLIYNLAGQRINKMQRGINIINGKKILK